MRALSIAYAAFAATQSKKGVAAYNKMLRGLQSIINAIPIEEQNVKANRKMVTGTLMKLGALFKKN